MMFQKQKNATFNAPEPRLYYSRAEQTAKYIQMFSPFVTGDHWS